MYIFIQDEAEKRVQSGERRTEGTGNIQREPSIIIIIAIKREKAIGKSVSGERDDFRETIGVSLALYTVQ